MEIFQPFFRGKNLVSKKDAGGKYIEMIDQKSILYVPINVLPSAVYNIKIEMAKKCGNGIVYCNIYGNQNYDFPQARVMCDSVDWVSYSFDVKTHDFPKSVPMIFRIWREPTGTGTILIRKIFIELIEDANGSNDIKREDICPRTNSSTLSEPLITVTDFTKNLTSAPPSSQITTVPPKAPTMPFTPIACIRSAGDLGYFVNKQPKLLPEEVGEDGIKVSVVISLFNRIEYLDRTLHTYARQTMSKDEFEIVIVDDKSTDDILGLCKNYAASSNLKFQHILVDKTKGAIPPASFNQALTNNIGFKNSRGKVIIISGPETLLQENNIELSWKNANEGYCIYGNIYRSSANFVEFLRNNDWRNIDFKSLLNVKGATDEKSQLGGFWWYYVAVRKEHIMNINGVDERYMRGITAEDDNFAFRMYQSGVPLIRNPGIVGIHQDHSNSDQSDLHSIRQNANEWGKLRNHNIALLNDWFKTKDAVANKNIDWGSNNAIIKKEIF